MFLDTCSGRFSEKIVFLIFLMVFSRHESFILSYFERSLERVQRLGRVREPSFDWLANKRCTYL